jgi:hypothetical protein
MQTLADPDVREQMKREHRKLKALGETSMPEALTIVETPGAPELECYVGRNVGRDRGKSRASIRPTRCSTLRSPAALRVVFRSGLATSGNARSRRAADERSLL